MTRDRQQGASSGEDRAVVNGAASVSALRASIPSAMTLADPAQLLSAHSEAKRAVEEAEYALLQARAWAEYVSKLAAWSKRRVRPKTGVTKEVSRRHNYIIQALPVDEAEAKSPAEIYASFVAETGDRVTSIETFRTTIWRMADGRAPFTCDGSEWFILRSDAGYWKEPAQAIEARRAETTGSVHESAVGETDASDAALLADICDNMAEVLKPLPGGDGA
jgi:hypothetical protein